MQCLYLVQSLFPKYVLFCKQVNVLLVKIFKLKPLVTMSMIILMVKFRKQEEFPVLCEHQS